jgi:hypothetical protein
MKRARGMCEACGRRTAVSYAHGNLCEWCWPMAAPGCPQAADDAPREAGTVAACRDCGAALSDARQGRCLDCEVSHAFDSLSIRTETRGRASKPKPRS